jgi:hypothetical protein
MHDAVPSTPSPMTARSGSRNRARSQIRVALPRSALEIAVPLGSVHRLLMKPEA